MEAPHFPYYTNSRRLQYIKGDGMQRRDNMDLGLKGKVALVLAASKGLGRASAAALAAEGTVITIGARNRQALEQAAREIQRESGSRILAVPTDVTKVEELEAIVATMVHEFGRIDILVNNAGGPPALLTRISMRPNSWTVVATIASSSSTLVTSVGTARIRLPLSRCISRAACSNACLFRAPIVITVPSAASAAALARPSPLLAGYTRGNFPLRLKSILSLLCIPSPLMYCSLLLLVK